MLGYEVESEEDVEPDAETVGELDMKKKPKRKSKWHINL